MPKGLRYFPADSKIGRQIAARTGAAAQTLSVLSNYDPAAIARKANQEAWNRLIDAQKKEKHAKKIAKRGQT